MADESTHSPEHQRVSAEPPDRDGGPGWRVTPAPDGRGTPPDPPSVVRRRRRRLLAFFVGLLVLNVVLAITSTGPASRVRVPYLPVLVSQLKDGNVKSITSQGSTIQGTFRTAVSYPAKGQKGSVTARDFTSEVPAFAGGTTLIDLLAKQNVTVDAKPVDSGAPWWQRVLIGIVPTLLLFGLLIWFMGRAARRAGGVGGAMALGRSRARRADAESVTVTFDDVAGIDDVESELVEIVDFLKRPERYARLGARLPTGVLLSGPPGTGKTLLARAVAGQAAVPFFTMSASEFIEMIVGVGASRVRDLFTQAKAAAPAIIFIDELDAIGRRRGDHGFAGGGHDEREQTLNQILTEMDGFDPRSGIVVLAATNRPDVLDPALLRPGRFDRRIHVSAPDRDGREAILGVHTRSIPLAGDVDLGRLAAATPGMVGADLANLANEAALTATRRDHESVEMSDFTDALERIVLGTQRTLLMTEEDRRRTAYHEAGHAIAGMLIPGADPVRKISIIPRGRALGVTLSVPDRDQLNYDVDALTTRIKVALAGRAAEMIIYGSYTTGAESDLEQVTAIARRMVGRWGMSDAVGPLVTIPADDAPQFGAMIVSPETQKLVDDEARAIVNSAQADVLALLRDNRPKLDALTEALLAHESLDQDQAYAAAGVATVGA